MRTRPSFSPMQRIPSRLKPLVAMMAIACAGAVQAAPQGGVVQAGSASIVKTSAVRTDIIQASDRAVINWQSFSIGAGELVNFQQPSASSAVLNRVIGIDPSVILGRLTANGQVFIVNPNGVFFGQNSRLDVGGLIATTANISTANFMSGRLAFDDVTNRRAMIVNEGTITAADGGLVALIAPGVSNQGVIRANLGRVALASGNAFTLDLYGDKLVSFAVDDKVVDRLTDAMGRPLRAFVDQAGTIEADGGSVTLTANTAKAVLDNVINMSGVVRAQAVTQRGGEIVLHAGDGEVRVSGLLDATGAGDVQRGGTVSVLGGDVVLAGGARVDVSGGAGGGKIMLGGDFHGGGSVARASTSTIEAGSILTANATSNGAGGEIVVWSDGHTQFDGHAAARGAAGGIGGFIEISGRNTLGLTGTVDLSRAGTLLLDPGDFTIDSTVANTISTTLRSGANSVNTGYDNITVNALIDGRGGTAGGALTLNGGQNVAINKDIYTNNGAVNIATTGGTLAMAATGGGAATPTTIYSGTGAITLSASGAVSAQHLVSTGAVSVTSTAGAVTLAQNLGGSSGAGLGSLAVAAAGNVGLKGIKSSGAVNVTTGTGGAITVGGTILAGGNVTLGHSGGAGNAANADILLQHSVFTTGGNLTLNGVGKLNPAGDEIGFNTSAGLSTGTEIQTSASALSASSQAAGRTATCTTGATGCTGGAPAVAWDAITVKLTLKTDTGNVALNGGLLWDGANPINSMKWYRGDDATTARSALTAAPVRWFGANIVAGPTGTVTLDGTFGYPTAANATNAATGNPGHPLVNDQLPTPDNQFYMLVNAPGQTSIVAGGSLGGNVDNFVFNNASTRDSTLNLTTIGANAISILGTNPSHPGGGQLIPPSPNQANVGTAPTFLAEISLPAVSASASATASTATSTAATVANSTQVEAAVTANSAANSGESSSGTAPSAQQTIVVGGRGVSQSADLGRSSPIGGAATDIFAQNIHVVDGGGSGDAQYFSQSPFQAAGRDQGETR